MIKNLALFSLLAVLTADLSRAEDPHPLPASTVIAAPLPFTPIPQPSETPKPLVSPQTSSSPAAEFRQLLWSLREGVTQGNLTSVTLWRAERTLQSALLSRMLPDPNSDKSIALQEADQIQLKEKLSRLTITLSNKPLPKTKDDCQHWIEVESSYGKRFFCEGYDSGSAFEFLNLLQDFMK